MISALSYRSIRQIVPIPNLAFVCQFSDKIEKIKDAKAVASPILQNNDAQTECNEEKGTEDPPLAAEGVMSYPEEPTNCCMSGCANCVWIVYAEKLSAYYRDGGQKAIEEINEKVVDTNIKAFLHHEIRMRLKVS